MPKIGQFLRTNTGYAGTLRTLSLNVELVLEHAEPTDAEKAPDFRVRIGEDGPEIGAGWKRTGEKAGEYVTLLIDDPAFAAPIRANLFQSGEDRSAWDLYWNRPQRRAERN
ncbi:DUF736 domain-containing protein [Sinorhizobium sp. 8-89]|uniref:DUF736 domain-containing protein n=1 Tax=Sinorhizobium sp. 7-81 TaxID=3049087 RepID=UPI0024C2188E|nr:DUF736 domain-containing protein [Sinorhizobium sp. 7-81]MDK1389716.1 DUF736 domain-containing protein [Sinorhizobium sp. 7-81]